jgi:hypothetical protein
MTTDIFYPELSIQRIIGFLALYWGGGGSTTISRIELDSASGFLLIAHSPIEDIVVLETVTTKKVPEYLTRVRVVGLVIEAKGTSIVQVDNKLVGKPTAEDLSRGGHLHLLLHDSVVQDPASQ